MVVVGKMGNWWGRGEEGEDSAQPPLSQGLSHPRNPSEEGNISQQKNQQYPLENQ